MKETVCDICGKPIPKQFGSSYRMIYYRLTVPRLYTIDEVSDNKAIKRRIDVCYNCMNNIIKKASKADYEKNTR